MQTNLNSDKFCGYNQEAATFFWTFQDGQYNNMYATGEVGVPANGGSAGSYIPGDLIDNASFLDGRETILSRCNPPIPSLDSVNRENFDQMMTKSEKESASMDSSILLQKYTKEKKSQVALSSIDYNRFTWLQSDAQNPRFIFENFAASRGGLDSRNWTKSAWSNQNGSPTYDPNECRMTLDPARACGDYCESVSGYTQTYLAPGKPQPDYPFNDITSQELYSVGAAECGSQFYTGARMDEGECPPMAEQVFTPTYAGHTMR
jgi:hypothetical protein